MRTDSNSPGPQSEDKRRRVLRRILLGLLWTVSGVIAIGVLAVVLFATLVNYGAVHRYLIGVAQREATARLGAPVTLQNFSLHFSSLRVDLYGLTVDGAAPYRTPPLLRVNHVEASVRIVSLFRMQWYLNDLHVDHPVAWVVEGKDGKSNLPSLASGGSQSHLTPFTMAIRHAVLTNGEIYFNDRPRALYANVHDLALQTTYSSLQRAYHGDLAYKDGYLRYGSLRPVAHTLAVRFTLEPGVFILDQAVLRSGQSTLQATGTVRSFSNPKIHVHYSASLNPAEIGHLLKRPAVPSGTIELTGDASYHRTANEKPLQALTLNGRLTSGNVKLNTKSVSTRLSHLVAHYSVTNGDATLKDLKADVLGGEITAHGTVTDISSKSHGVIHAKLHGISLSGAEQLLGKSRTRSVRLRGKLNGTALASWGPTLKNLRVKLNAAVAGHAAAQDPVSAATVADPPGQTNKNGTHQQTTIPVQGEIHLTYSRATGKLQLNSTKLHTPAINLSLNGALGKRSSIAVHFHAIDISRLTQFADLLPTTTFARILRSLNLSGKMSFQGHIRGKLTAPHITGLLTASNLSIRGSHWKLVRTNIDLSPSAMRIQNAHLEPQSQGQINLDARAALNHWSFSKTSAIHASVNASDIQLAVLKHLAKKSIPVAGVLNARMHIHGSMAEPDGHGSIHLSRATAFKQPISSAALTFSAANKQIQTNAHIGVAGGAVKAHVNIQPDQRSYTAQVASSGIQISRLEFLRSKGVKATGALSLQATGAGTFKNPEMEADIEVPHATIEKHPLSGLHLNVHLADRQVNAVLASTVAHAPVTAKAQIALTGNYPASASVNTQRVPLQPFLALYAPSVAEQISGHTQVHLTLHGPLKNWQAIDAQITIPFLNVSYKNKVELAASAPIQAEYRNGVIAVQPVSIRGTDTNLKLQGAMPISGSGPRTLQVAGTVDLKIAQLLYPSLQSSGTARIDIHASNAAKAGGLSGQVKIADANLSSSTIPTGLQHGNGVITLTSNRVTVSSFHGKVGGGTVTAQGGVSLRPSLGFDLGMTAKNVRILYPQGMRDDFSANLRFTGSPEKALVAGSVGVSDVSFTPGFDLTSLITQFSGGVSAPTAPGFTQNVALNIAVHSTNTLNPESKTVSVAGTAALFVRGTAAHPSLLGRVNLASGSVIFHGDRFVLTGGTVQFVSPVQIRPVLNLSLSTTIQQYDIDLRFTGPVEQMRGQYTSSPSLPQADIISLLAFGTTTEAKANTRVPASQAAESMIASQVSSQVTSRISRIAGISQLSVSPVLSSGTSQGPPGAVITIRQQVTGNLFVTFSTNVASTQSETVQGEYRLSPRVAVSATRDPNGGFAVDALIKRSW